MRSFRAADTDHWFALLQTYIPVAPVYDSAQRAGQSFCNFDWHDADAGAPGVRRLSRAQQPHQGRQPAIEHPTAARASARISCRSLSLGGELCA